jgi:hypothetical protein
VDFSAAQSEISPSHFNTGMTVTSPPQTTNPVAPPEDAGFALPPSPAPSPSPYPEEKKRSSLTGRRGFVLAIIAILAVLLVGTTFESGMLGSVGAPAVNSANNPFTGGQLYTAYAANQASYANKTVYIKDSLDFGVSRDFSNGLYYSSVDSGNVILFWSGEPQLGQLNAGTTVLAKCSVDGEEFSPGAGNLLILENCGVVSVQSQSQTATATATGVGVPVSND